MLTKVNITNFRKHRSASFDLQPGFTVFRGANEAGKSTAFEAIAYALFGVKAIRTSLEDAVTYGESVNSLKVELDIVIDGVTYSVKRGKPGAECTYGGDGIVTGQTEVTNFLCRQLKIDAASATRLMLSNQNEIRGALESGPKATTELIERLAEFDQIDKLIDLMQEKLTLGSGATAQAQVDAARGRLDRAKEVVEPDFKALETAVTSATSAAEDAKAALGTARAARDEAQTQVAKQAAAASERGNLERQASAAATKEQQRLEEIRLLKLSVPTRPQDVDSQIQKLLQRKTEISQAEAISKAWAEVGHLCGALPQVSRYPGNADALQKAIDDLRRYVTGFNKTFADNRVKLTKLEAELTHGNCTFCGKDFSDLPEVMATNALLQADIEETKAAQGRLTAGIEQAKAEEFGLLSYQKASREYTDAASLYPAYVKADHSTVPPVLEFTAVALPDSVTAQSIDESIKALRAEVRLADEWDANIHHSAAELERCRAELKKLNARLEEIGSVSEVESLKSHLDAANLKMSQAQQTLDELRVEADSTRWALGQAKTRWEWAVAEAASAEQALNLATEALKALDFNNALMKKVRAARPLIADKLWNLVLSAVSAYFSEIRGFKSAVSKSADGFFVDGHPVQTLSGSTLDILGLAIRVALVRTFLPGAPFLVLDEPAAACDPDRTESMLGFLVAAGFKQVLLVTHEDVSESVADHIITLGD